ncbi:MAG: hypothetical protein ACOC4I_04710 [Spirochaetota bacterium]
MSSEIVEIHPPEYISFSTRDRDQFLSQLGSFTSEERAIFHRMCSAWQAVIPVDRFIAQLPGDNSETLRTTLSLVAKLWKAHVAVLLTKPDGEDRKPVSIVLTDERDRRYFELSLEEMVDRFRADPSLPLPRQAMLVEEGLDIPEEHLTNLTTAELTTLIAGDASVQPIYRITTPGGTRIMVPGSRLRNFPGFSIQRLRYDLANNNLAAAVSRILHSSLTELRQGITTKDPRFWFSLTGTILSNRASLEAQRSFPVSQDFFVAAEFLNAYVDGQLTNLRRKKELETRIREDCKTVLTSISSRTDGYISREDLEQLLEGFREEYDDDYAQFRSRFLEEALKAPPRKVVGELVEVTDGYFHRQSVYRFFLDQLEQTSAVYSGLYRSMLSLHIRSGSREHREVFFSREGLVADLHDRLRSDNPRLLEFLDSPEVIAEAIVIWAREQGPIRDVEELKRIMQRHFVPGTTEFYDLAVMLDMNLLELFDRAFRSLSPIRQILYRLFGRHEALRARFIEEASKATLPPAASRNAVATPRASGPTLKAAPARGVRPVSGQPGPGRQAAESGNTTRAVRPRAQKKPGTTHSRQYTRRDQDKAWDEFRKRIGE